MSFMTDEFLLKGKIANTLYHDYAKRMPIIDYHCHLDAKAIAEDKQFSSITELWLGADHYKWRLMRSYGIDERYITGDGDDKVKFQKWAEVLSRSIGNPMYHWSALELKAYFNIDEQLTESNWEEIYTKCNHVLSSSDFTTQQVVATSNVDWICTTDDPVDSLAYHQMIARQDRFKTSVTPSFRPDKALAIADPAFLDYIKLLEQSVGFQVSTFEEMVQAMHSRIQYFHENGCFISDHGFGQIPFEMATEQALETLFARRMSGATLSDQEVSQYETALFLGMARKYAEVGWAMQIHFGVIRNSNERMLKMVGTDAGFDIIGDWNCAHHLSQLLNALEATNQLPKTILYNLNPASNEVVATMIGAFQQAGTRGKIQFGTGWWFNDQKDGMEKQMKTLANLGLFSTFVGMLTDSRSFLSYTRHEYFRRILCNLIGNWAEQGEVDDDIAFLGKMVEDICYHNAHQYFNLSDSPLRKN